MVEDKSIRGVVPRRWELCTPEDKLCILCNCYIPNIEVKWYVWTQYGNLLLMACEKCVLARGLVW